MPEPKTAKKPARRSAKKKAAAAPGSRGLAHDALGSGSPPAAVARLAEAIESDGGTVLAPYKDPLGGHWQIFAALPIIDSATGALKKTPCGSLIARS